MLEKAIVKCPCCGKTRTGSDLIWQVRTIDGKGQEIYNPCCSQNCALDVQADNMEFHRKRLDIVAQQVFQKMTVEVFRPTNTD